MEALEGDAQEITIIDPYRFSIQDTSAMGKYEGGATAVQVKQATPVSFLPMSEAMNNTEFLVPDEFKSMFQWPPMLLHLGMQALASFQQSHDGSLPGVWDESDAAEIVAEVQRLNSALPEGAQVP